MGQEEGTLIEKIYTSDWPTLLIDGSCERT